VNIIKFLILAFLCFCMACSKGSSSKSAADETLAAQWQDSTGSEVIIKVLNLNMYVGFDVGDLAGKNLDSVHIVLVQGQKLYKDFLASRPMDRIRNMAQQIKLLKPHVIGLQEVQYFINHTDNYSFDFLSELVKELNSIGAPAYDSVYHHMNPISIDVKDTNEAGSPDSLHIDFYEGNALLYMKDSLTLEQDSNHVLFDVIPVPYLDSTVIISRGFNWAVFKAFGSTKFHLLNTHLEVGTLPFVGVLHQQAQADEIKNFIISNIPVNEPAIFTGDFNAISGSKTLLSFINRGFFDAYVEGGSSDPGNTCCSDVLDISDSNYGTRIDYILGRSMVSVDTSYRVMDARFSADSISLLPSDHAGVFANFRFH